VASRAQLAGNAREVYGRASMIVRQIFDPQSSTYTYLLGGHSARE
jgi:hypothetical protein